MCSIVAESPTTDKEEFLTNGLLPDPAEDALKEKKKKKHHGEKRKRSCSTDSTTSSTSSHKRHKKKKRKKSKDEPLSPKVNPIFLWVKQDHTRIVEVHCEDYDKRNRIKLTKTAGGWVAIPRTNMFCPEPLKEMKEESLDVKNIEVKEEKEEVAREKEAEAIVVKEERVPAVREEEMEVVKNEVVTVERDDKVTLVKEENVLNDVEEEAMAVVEEEGGEGEAEVEDHRADSPPPPTLELQTNPPPPLERECSPPHLDIKEPPALTKESVQENTPTLDAPPSLEKPTEKEPEGVRDEPECTESQCCPIVNVDENHNNEVEPAESCPSELCKNLKGEVEEEKVVKKSVEEPAEPIEIPDECDEASLKTHEEDCENLMNEIADMCFVSTLKEEDDGKELKDLSDIYTFVPSPVPEKEEVKSFTPLKEPKEVIEAKKPPSPEVCPMNLVVHPERDKTQTLLEDKDLKPLKQSDLESLDILWRLPEGTTISQSKGATEGKPPCPPGALPLPSPAFSQPIQEEPLNLGKPKPKEEKKTPTTPKQPPPSEDSKLMELLKIDHRLQSNPLDQLKEVLSDPDLCVPDPLLVPRARLSALIANPKKEIPKLLAQTKEINYPKLMDPDLMVVSLAHLQSILQKSGKEADLSLYQQQMLSTYDKIDPTTAAINQMLWLPYLSQLEAKHNQELMAMLYPHYMYPQSFIPPAPATTRFPIYQRPTTWPRAETSKPKPSAVAETKRHEAKHREVPQHLHAALAKQQQQHEMKPKLKVRDNLIEPKLKVRDNLVEPNQRTNLLKFDPTSPFLPPVGVPPNSSLWHPLFSSPDSEYPSGGWHWTTPVTVSGE